MVKSNFDLINQKLTFFIITNGGLLSQIPTLLSSPTSSLHHGGILSWWKCSAKFCDHLYSLDHRDHHNHCLDQYHHLKNRVDGYLVELHHERDGVHNDEEQDQVFKRSRRDQSPHLKPAKHYFMVYVRVHHQALKVFL